MIADGAIFASVLLFLVGRKEGFMPYEGEYC